MAKEIKWLPSLADAVSLPIPEIVGIGAPGIGYPFAWTIRRWIEGTPLTDITSIDRKTVAADLGEFLRQLQHADPAGPGPGQHSAGRGAP